VFRHCQSTESDQRNLIADASFYQGLVDLGSPSTRLGASSGQVFTPSSPTTHKMSMAELRANSSARPGVVDSTAAGRRSSGWMDSPDSFDRLDEGVEVLIAPSPSPVSSTTGTRLIKSAAAPTFEIATCKTMAQHTVERTVPVGDVYFGQGLR